MKANQSIFKKRYLLFTLIIPCLVLLSACQPAAAAPEAPTAQITEAAPAAEEEAQIQATPTEPIMTALSDQPYASPSGAFEIFLPKDWNCSESGQLRVDCQPPDGKASIALRATATGYELMQAAFEALITAETAFTYSEKKAYSEISRDTEEGLVAISAAWREGDVQWQSEDIFTRSGAGVYQLSLAAEQAQWEEFAPLFNEIITKSAFHPEAFSGAPLYAQIRKYTAPDVLFTLDIPTAWSRYGDVGSIENTQLEGFLSPDLHAAVQVAIYRQGSLIKVDIKAKKTLEIMRKLYGSDLRVSHDKALPDGRERLAWSAARRKVSGISFFDSFGGSMYIFSVVWDDDFKDMYTPTLDAVVESFGHD